jgi:AraC-like DNA-binding protein
MLGEALDAAEASFKVGYESPSQFSREYRRLFGAPPRRDIETLRHVAVAPVVRLESVRRKRALRRISGAPVLATFTEH